MKSWRLRERARRLALNPKDGLYRVECHISTTGHRTTWINGVRV